uniref:NAD(P)-binding protein n=1 Tax=Moniliophthora roreri TaxID=221103 RepID=A0A0W0F0C9_MONRR
MSSPLSGKVAIVTGSSRSIGASIAKRLAKDGATVVINYVSNADAANEVVNDINSKGPGKAQLGKVDILVLNAGIMGSKVLADVDEQFYDDHMNINVKGPLFLTKAAAPLLPSGGRVIFFSTSLTKASAVLPNALVYVASKAAIEQLSRVLAKDLGGRGITVNTVSPGPVDTPLFRAGKPEQVIQFIANQNPSKRLGQPDDIAPIVAFLSGPEAGWINGQNILVNGAFVV